MKKHVTKILKLVLICFVMLATFITPNLLSNNQSNIEFSAATMVSKPTINLKEGSYLESKTIKLSCKTVGATIYYTTNGTIPSSKSTKYTKPFNITKDCHIRAIAIKNGIISNELIVYYDIYSYMDIDSDVKRYTLAIKNNKISKLSSTDQKICNTVKNIIRKNITDDMTKYEKVKTIHNYIINHTVYDYDNLKYNTIPAVSYTIEGVIQNGTAVCQGYAETFQLFMNLLSIPNKFISGYGNGGSHAWNLVKLNGNWYHVDTTWDDPVSESGNETLQYNYFLISDKWMSSDHTWVVGNYPACNSDALMYKIYGDVIIDSINDYQSKFTKLYNNGLRTITILYPENKIPDLHFYYSLSGKNSCKYSYPVKFGDYYIFTVYGE